MAVPTKPPARAGRKSDQTLDARLSETLIREIIESRYPPGAWLREQEISDRHGVSRASVREALRNVARAGFVEMQPWRGAQVTHVGLDELIEIFSLLEDMYAQSARLAAEHFPEAKFGRLDAQMRGLDEAVVAGASKAQLCEQSFELGRFIGRYCGSRIAYRMVVQVGSLALWQQLLLTPGTPLAVEQSAYAHRILVSAIKTRQPEIAETAARLVVMITRRSLISENAERPEVETLGRGSRSTARPRAKSAPRVPRAKA